MVDAARKAKNFISFNLGRIFGFPQRLPAEHLRQVQYETWVEGLNWSPEKIAWDNEIVEELQAKFQPGDNHLFEKALQTAFVGTDFPLSWRVSGFR